MITWTWLRPHVADWRMLTVALCVPVLVLQLLWTPGARANHNKWWTCNDACSRCARRVMPMEDLITQLYPGLFSTAPPSDVMPVADLVPVAGDPFPAESNYSVTPITSGADAVNQSTAVGSNSSVYVDSISARLPTSFPSGLDSGCCETVMEYVTPQNVTMRGRVYKVVHLRHMFQFIPIGRCKPGSRCTGGQCVDQFRAHWVLVYNNTRPLKGAAPVSFAPIEVPSHCECFNVGHP